MTAGLPFCSDIAVDCPVHIRTCCRSVRFFHDYVVIPASCLFSMVVHVSHVILYVIPVFFGGVPAGGGERVSRSPF